MAERVLVSPGVFDREIDGTIRPADPAGIGPVFIAPRAKGPAMNPVRTKDQDEDAQFFGVPDPDGKDFGAYTNRLYLRQESTPSTFIRVLGQEGTGVTPGYTVPRVVALGSSGSADGNVLVVIHSSGAVSLEGTLTSSADELAIQIAGGDGLGGDLVVTASLFRNSDRYITKVLNTDPEQFSTKNYYIQAVYDFADKTPETGVDSFFVSELPSVAGTLTDAFITGATTNVISQPFDSIEHEIFGVGSVFAGDTANTEVKVSITNIKKSPNPNVNEYGTFTLVVRHFRDTDRQLVAVESFSNLTLDRNSPNYVCRRVGDRYRVWNTTTKKFDVFGEYPNQSRYIYIIPTPQLRAGTIPDSALPWGFKGYRRFTSGSVGDKASWPELPLVQNMVFKNDFTTKVYWGVEVINNASGAINHGVPDRLKHVSKALLAASGTVDQTFSLKYVSGAVDNIAGYSATGRLTEVDFTTLSTSIGYNTASASPTGGSDGYLSLDNIENTVLAKFTFPIADGFDGVNQHLEDPFSPEDMLTDADYQTHAYRTAVDMISNADEFDFNELAIPGIYANKIRDKAIEVVEDRGDMFYMADISGASVNDAVDSVVVNQLDTNYAGVWYPYLKLNDEVNNKIVEVPPTVVLPAVLAFNDRVAFPWFAPAGFNRGGLRRFGVVEAKDKLTKADRDRLYENRVNPIATFPEQGVVVWGQKTLQIAASALDRINVRRMLLRVRKTIAKEALNIVFEPNVPRTWERFRNRVTPFLERVRENAGIDDFRLVLDERTTTEDLIERNIMFGKIAIKPTRAAEFILLDFFVTNNVAGFEEAA